MTSIYDLIILCRNLMFIVFIASSYCYSQQSNVFSVNGEIDTMQNAVYSVIFQKDGLECRDTVILDGKKFKYSGEISEPTKFLIIVNNYFNPKLVRDQIVYSFWVSPGEEIYFKGRRSWLKSFLKSNHEVEFFTDPTQFDLLRGDFERKVQYFNNLKIDYVHLSEKLSGQKLTNEQKSLFDLVYIKNNPNDYFSLFLIRNYIKWHEDVDFNIVDSIINLTNDELKSTHLMKEVRTFYLSHPKMIIGREFVDFSLLDTSNNIVKLSDFREKYILVQFWASWCAPCRKKHPSLLTLYDKFKSDNFEIIGISLDSSKEKWIHAIKEDKINWIHVSEMNTGIKQLLRDYAIDGIPTNFLLDENGRVLARDIDINKLDRILEDRKSK